MNNEEQLLVRIAALRQTLHKIGDHTTPGHHLRACASAAVNADDDTSLDNLINSTPQIMEDSLSEAHQKIEALATSLALIDDIATEGLRALDKRLMEANERIDKEDYRIDLVDAVAAAAQHLLNNRLEALEDNDLDNRISALETMISDTLSNHNRRIDNIMKSVIALGERLEDLEHDSVPDDTGPLTADQLKALEERMTETNRRIDRIVEHSENYVERINQRITTKHADFDDSIATLQVDVRQLTAALEADSAEGDTSPSAAVRLFDIEERIKALEQSMDFHTASGDDDTNVMSLLANSEGLQSQLEALDENAREADDALGQDHKRLIERVRATERRNDRLDVRVDRAFKGMERIVKRLPDLEDDSDDDDTGL